MKGKECNNRTVETNAGRYWPLMANIGKNLKYNKLAFDSELTVRYNKKRETFRY